MNDVITKVGKVAQKNGRAARVVHIEEGIAFGFDSADAPCGWDVKTGVESTEAEPAEGYNIVGPWIEPKPFRISDHGPGVYLTRDGREAEVTCKSCDREDNWPWNGHIIDGSMPSKTWKDNGHWLAPGESGEDLVRYLRPLPQPEWTPTDHYQQTTIVDGCEWTSRWYGKPPSAARIEQRWTRGTEEEWRPVTIKPEGA
jgi:hypothetical protein